MRERGYDHTERIARELLKLVHDREIILEENILFRKLDTPSQTTLSQKKRVSMVHGVFAIHNTPEGRDIILLDDVVTTGATLYEASMTLKKAGAKRIFCVSLAH
jgi:predicted amidophosphoribosyltransferase